MHIYYISFLNLEIGRFDATVLTFGACICLFTNMPYKYCHLLHTIPLQNIMHKYLVYRIAKTNILTTPGTMLNSPFYLYFIYAATDFSTSQQGIHNYFLVKTNH